MNDCKCMRLHVKKYLIIMHKKLKLLHFFATLSLMLCTYHTDLKILQSFAKSLTLNVFHILF